MTTKIDRIRRTVGEEFQFSNNHSKALLMVHGIGGGPLQLRELAQAIHQQCGYDCHGILLPGHCGSFDELATCKYPRWTRRVEKVYKNLCQHYEQVDLCGFSLGGVLCLNLARKYDINNLISLAAPMWFLHNRLPLEKIIRKGHSFLTKLPAPQVEWPAIDPIDSKEINIKVPIERFFPGSLLYQLMLLMVNVREHIADVKCQRALIVQSKADPAAAPKSAEHIYQHLSCSDKDIKWLRFAYHEFLFGRYKDRVIRHVVNFLNEQH